MRHGAELPLRRDGPASAFRCRYVLASNSQGIKVNGALGVWDDRKGEGKAQAAAGAGNVAAPLEARPRRRLSMLHVVQMEPRGTPYWQWRAPLSHFGGMGHCCFCFVSSWLVPLLVSGPGKTRRRRPVISAMDVVVGGVCEEASDLTTERGVLIIVLGSLASVPA